MKILGTGLQGLVGSRIVKLLSSSYIFENISRSTGVDITDKRSVFESIKNSNADIVLHLAAKADVDGCEKEKDLGEKSEAWQINVEGTRNVASACEQFEKKLIYISTDFVFDGEKEFYTEKDTPNPLNWYAQTKYTGEKIVENLKTPWIIARIAYPYRARFEKKDLVRAVKEKLEKGEKVTMVTDHIMTPTYIDDIATAVDVLSKNDQTNGIYHVVGSEFISPFDAALSIAHAFDCDKNLVEKTTLKAYFMHRATRPFRLALKNDKISQLGVAMSTFGSGLEKIKEQL